MKVGNLAVSGEKGVTQQESKAALLDNQRRERVIIRTSWVGIVTNVLLALCKAGVGVMSNSIAVLMDAVNNLSDAASSIITIVGTKLAGKEADREHPFGYGRVEYLTAMLISALVLYAGGTALIESVKKIIHPEVPAYNGVGLLLLALSVGAKILLGNYVKQKGEKANSDSLVASGVDAMMDSVISLSTLVAAGIYILWDISLEAWLGAIISLFIIKSGVGMLGETISRLLGEAAGPELARKIMKTVMSFPGVHGCYDLVLNNYGPDAYNGSLHIEVPDSWTANDLDRLIRRIQWKVYEEHHVLLTAIGVYAVNTGDNLAAEIKGKVTQLVLSQPGARQLHGFYLYEDDKVIRFDVVIGFDVESRIKAFKHIVQKVEEAFPEYQIEAAMDMDYSTI